MQFVTVKEAHNISDLLILKSRIESEGIECRLKNELTTQVLSHIPSMFVELQVAKKDIKHVKDIMIETGELKSEQVIINCPKCASEKFKIKRSIKERWKIVVAIFMSLIAIAPVDNFIGPTKFVCLQCDHEFSS